VEGVSRYQSIPLKPERSGPVRVEIWGDITCPWSYIGKARFDKALATFAHRDEVEVVHRSFEIDPGAETEAVWVVDMIAAKYGLSIEEARAIEEQVASSAHSEGLGYRVEGQHGNTFDIHRLLHLAKARGRHEELMDHVLQANFAEERSVFDRKTLVDLAVEVGLDRAEAREVLAHADTYADEVRADEREAAEQGARSVPFFLVDRRNRISGDDPSAELFTQALEQAWQAWQDRAAERGGDSA
jgi:predicted DsbA family dithiol-disulfide isomerase